MRIERDALFMQIAEAFAQRGTCLRASVGAVAVQGRHIVSHGYVGAPAGLPHCLDVGCGGGVPGGNVHDPSREPELIFPNGCTRTVHAEANLVAYAARVGVTLEGCVVYTTLAPCQKCAELLSGAGVTRVIYRDAYRLTDGIDLLDRLNIPAVQLV